MGCHPKKTTMKIRGVKFKNINSLSGEWEIRFDRSPISDTGFFAIVGPNGSGKSSILDAITLGLYGRTARLGNPETGILNPKETESYAEVTFSVLDQCYCSTWSVQQAGGNPEPPDMSLFSLNGEKSLLESRTIPVRNRIAELTGLDFKRFCRSILLAQGEFSAFLNALENERAEILEKIIGPEMLRELAASIRSRADVETERLHRLKEDAAGFKTLDRGRVDEIRQSMEQAREDIRQIDRELEILREQEIWLERVERNPAARQDAEEAARRAETECADARKSLEQMEPARPAGLYKEALAQVELLKARAASIQGEILDLESRCPAREERIEGLETRLAGNRRELEAAGEHLAARTGDLIEAAQMDRDIAATGGRFLETVSRLEAMTREQQDGRQKRSELEEKLAGLDGRIQDLLQRIQARAGEEALEAEIPAMESLLVQLATIRKEMEKNRNLRGDARKADGRAEKLLRHADDTARKARIKTERLRARKTDRDGRLLAVYAGETKGSLKAGIEQGKVKLAACKVLFRIGRKGAAFKNVRDELAQIRSRMETLTQSISLEQSRLQALEGQIRQRDTVRRFDPERSLLQPGEPCPLCGAAVHPFLETGGLDFAELDGIVREREEKIRVQQAESDSLQTKAMALQARDKALEELQRAWAGQCAAADESWDFGDTARPLARIRAIRKEIRGARSKIRSAWWYAWQANRTDRSLGQKLEKLAKREGLLEKARDQHETRQKALVQIDDDLKRLDDNESMVRADLSGQLQRWQESLPEPGGESLPVARLRERSELYVRNLREQAAAGEEKQLLQLRQQAFSEILQRLAAETQQLSAESESIQKQLNAQKADRQIRFGALEPVRERQELESAVESLNAEEKTLSGEIDALRQCFAADRETLERLRDQARQTLKNADAAEKDILMRSGADGFGSLEAIRDGLQILQGEPERVSRLAVAEQALAAAREALAALRPKYATQDSLDAIHWKISDAIKRQKEQTQDIESSERTLEAHRQAEREYRELLQAIAVQEKAFAEAVAAKRSIEGQGETGGNLQQLLLNQLMAETNRHLFVLSTGRYALRPAGENIPGLHIEDALQARALRSVKTLSGGETFLVSLCLALGLSDMAGQHRKIESLLLDEGFGVLDEETLYKVMSALKNLQANGKTVGIVSHVKRLAQEIPTQIRLEKEPDGSSRITVAA